MRPLAALAVAVLLAPFASATIIEGNPLSRSVMVSAPDCVGPWNIIREEGVVPASETSLRVQHMGDPGTPEWLGEIANEITWNVGEFTGFDARTQRAQLGFRNEGPPTAASAFQLHCDEAGFFINTWQFAHTQPVEGAGPSASVARDVIPALRAWRDGGAVMMEADIRVPWVLNQRAPVIAGTAQVSFGFYARDETSGKYIAQLAEVWDNRPPGLMGTGIEASGSDGVVNFASGPLAPRDALGRPIRFLTHIAGDPQMQYQATFRDARRFRLMITHANFAAVLASLRERQAEISADPGDYTIISFGILGEVFPGTGNDDNVSVGASVKALTLRHVLPAYFITRPSRLSSR